jgi:tetratricopeptide (TPR) repeat protein
MLVGQALDFYDSEQRPASASEAVFWLQLSEIAQLEEDWQGSLKHLGAARTALGDEPGIEYLEVAIGLESAQTLIALEQFAEAEAAAGAAVRLGERLWGPDHFQLREINAQLAMAVAGQGEKRRAAQMLEDIIRSERSAENHPEAIAAYSAMLKKIAMN